MTRLLALAAAAVLVATLPRATLAEGRDFVEQRWGAVAAAFWRDSNGTYRAVAGTAWRRPSENDAIKLALNSCRNRGGQGCRIISNTFTGCGYIAIGSRGSRLQYGTGESPAAAVDECRKGGFTCQAPVGGCSN